MSVPSEFTVDTVCKREVKALKAQLLHIQEATGYTAPEAMASEIPAPEEEINTK